MISGLQLKLYKLFIDINTPEKSLNLYLQLISTFINMCAYLT